MQHNKISTQQHQINTTYHAAANQERRRLSAQLMNRMAAELQHGIIVKSRN